jgi:hypothetical protein
MAARYPELDIFPKAGMDLRDPSTPDWFANLWRPTRGNTVEVRPGLGQLEQLDTSVMTPGAGTGVGSGGYTRHLGSFLYNSNFGHRQVISVFEVDVQLSNAEQPSGAPVNLLETIHGKSKSVVVSIYDVTTGYQWEELLTVHTSEFTTDATIPQAHNHFESTSTITSKYAFATLPMDYLSLHYDKAVEDVSFVQSGDSVVMCLGPYGVWIYHGIDIAANRAKKISADVFSPFAMSSSAFVGFNNQVGYSEGSVIRPVAGTRGLNGTNFVYLNKSEFPRATAAVLSKNRVVYAQRSVVYFSDVGQPGAILADNFAEFQTEGAITALGEFNNNIYAFTETGVHFLAINQRVSAGPASANIVDVQHVRLSDKVGCVGPRSVCTTPFGVAWVSSRGVHIAGAGQQVQDISDPIVDYWDSGIVDPMSQYFPNNGTGGSKKQPSIIYRHQGKPTLAYEPQSESLFISYADHMLVYQFRAQSWAIWPLCANNRTGEVYKRQTVNALQVMADAKGVIVCGGLNDSDENGLNPASQTTSYYLCKLGLGGAVDRSCETEDHREYGLGRYKYSMVGGAWSATYPVAFYVNPPKVLDDATHTKKIYEIVIDIESFLNWPPAVASVSIDFTLTFGANFTLDGYGVPPESGTYAAYTFTPGANQLNIKRDTYASARRTIVGRLPMVMLRLVADANADIDPNLAVTAAQVYDGAAFVECPVMIYNFKHRFATTSRNYNDRLKTSVEYGYQTGQIGMNEGKQLKARGINTVLTTTTKSTSNIYNTIFSGDYKIRSGQYPDYNAPNLATRRYEQLQTIRQRMLNNRRIFDGLAKWSPTATASDAYLIDSPELNRIALSAHARGETIKTGVYGWCEDKADQLKLHRMALSVFAVGGNRRKGRT